MRWSAIILGGGSGTRMGRNKNKVLLPLCGVPILIRSVRAFQKHASQLIVVIRSEDYAEASGMLREYDLPVQLAIGGDTRQASVAAGLELVPDDAAVLIHDGARCLVDDVTIANCKQSVEQFGTGIAAVPVTDTIKKVDHGQIVDTPDRSTLWAMQTPQAFLKKDIAEAHAYARTTGFTGTDDASLLEHMGRPVRIAEGSPRNFKITRPEDLIMAESILNEKQSTQAFPLRIGHGYDVHQLTEGRKLILCGVEIPHSLGLLGHSDADVALHALMDAMLGSLALGDIGHLFPDTDNQYLGISSMELLRQVVSVLKEHEARVVNCDLTICAQKPKLAPFIQQMRENIAQALSISIQCVSVKATTTEHLGFEGRMEGISATSVVLTQLEQ